MQFRAISGLTGVVWVLGLVGCDADPIRGDFGDLQTGAEIGTVSVTEIALPEVLRKVSVVDNAPLQLSVVVNNVATELQLDDDGLWRGSVDVPVNQRSLVAVEWGTDYGASGYLKLAEREQFITVNNEQNTVVFGNNYNTAFDFDRDTRSNLAEIEQNRSPVNDLDVFINADGTFPTGGLEHAFSAECANQVPIEIKTLANGPDFTAWWCAKLQPEFIDADGNPQALENLEITVNVQDDQLFTDSGTNSDVAAFADDSIEIYIDGDNNKRGAYDGVDDFQFRFAPLGTGTFSQDRGPSVQLTSNFTYYNGGYILTASIPLDAVGIRNGFPFGINVEVNDDDDGGSRDAKKSWIGTEGVDISWRNTATFGTAQVP